MRGEIAVGFCVGNLVDDLGGFSRCCCLILLSYFLSIRCYSLGGIEVGVLWMWDLSFRSQWSFQTSPLLHWRKFPKTHPAGASKPKAADKPPNPDQGQGLWRSVQKEWSFDIHWASIEWCISCQRIQTIQGCRFQDASMQLVHGIGNGKHQPTATNSEVVVSECCPSSPGKNYAGAMKNGKSGVLDCWCTWRRYIYLLIYCICVYAYIYCK